MTELTLALILPALVGVSWLMRFWKNSHWTAIAGYGYLLGILATTLAMLLWDTLGLQLSFWPLATFLVLVSLLPLFFKCAPTTGTVSSHTPPVQSIWSRGAFWLLLGLLLLNYGGIFLEILWRPLYPWDAWMNWAPKAKVWFELRELTSWVTPGDWLHGTHPGTAYTLGNPEASRYPSLVPLIQTWTALGLGSWKDNLINLPWLQCAAALGLGFYGQARNLGVRPLNAMILVFLLLTLPLINVHTALAGYADLWLTTFFGLSAISLFLWSQTREPIQFILFVLLALACTQIKMPGVIWAALLLPAWLISLWPRFMSMAGTLLLITGGAIFWQTGGGSIEIPGLGKLAITMKRIIIPGLGYYAIDYHPVWKAVADQYLFKGSWHLLMWVFPLTLLYAALRRKFSLQLLPATVLVLEILVFLFLAFFFTSHYREALDGTTLNRASLPAIPVLFFYVMMLLQEKGSESSPPASE